MHDGIASYNAVQDVAGSEKYNYNSHLVLFIAKPVIKAIYIYSNEQEVDRLFVCSW